MPIGITAGRDGNVWFTESATDRVVRVTPAGAITEYALPTPAGGPHEIVAGPDGNLWLTERGGNKIARVVVSPPVAPPTPADRSGATAPSAATGGITVSPAGNGRLLGIGAIGLALVAAASVLLAWRRRKSHSAEAARRP